TQIQYKPSDKFLLNYSTFIGTDKPDSARLSRLFHNIYGIFNVTDKFGITAGFDIGTEEKFPGSDDKNTWYSPVLILKYTFHNKWAIAVRGEYYSDEDGVVIATGTLNGFKTTGFSLNIDYSPMKNFIVRLEARNLRSKDEIFIKPSGITNNNTFITSSIAVSF
ncbi:MAG: outer membrane beta-barrel protein, partial [Acidobacteria bacterium]|nr:outer membrane beta-barrel protein [Acidobacteriota bacterium]